MYFQLYTTFERGDILNNKYELAKEYSEGSSELEKCLLKLWNNGFETIGCCKGHADKPKSKPYIGFKFNDIEKSVRLLSSLDKENIIINFTSQDHKKTFVIRKNSEPIYDNIMNAIDGYKIDNDIMKILTFLSNYDDAEYITIRIYYKDNEYKVYVNTVNPKIIDEFKEKYCYKLLNEKFQLYHFIVT